jgi:hypothetical protein
MAMNAIQTYEIHKIAKWAYELRDVDKKKKMLGLVWIQLDELERIVCDDLSPLEIRNIKRFLEKTEMIMETMKDEELGRFASGLSLGLFLAEMLYLSAHKIERYEQEIRLMP